MGREAEFLCAFLTDRVGTVQLQEVHPLQVFSSSNYYWCLQDFYHLKV